MAFQFVVIGVRWRCAIPAQALEVGKRDLGGGLFTSEEVLEELE